MEYVYTALGLLAGFLLGRAARKQRPDADTAKDDPERGVREQWERMMRYDGLEEDRD